VAAVALALPRAEAAAQPHGEVAAASVRAELLLHGEVALALPRAEAAAQPHGVAVASLRAEAGVKLLLHGEVAASLRAEAWTAPPAASADVPSRLAGE
jgi:hypothetical protein